MSCAETALCVQRMGGLLHLGFEKCFRLLKGLATRSLKLPAAPLPVVLFWWLGLGSCQSAFHILGSPGTSGSRLGALLYVFCNRTLSRPRASPVSCLLFDRPCPVLSLRVQAFLSRACGGTLAGAEGARHAQVCRLLLCSGCFKGSKFRLWVSLLSGHVED